MGLLMASLYLCLIISPISSQSSTSHSKFLSQYLNERDFRDINFIVPNNFSTDIFNMARNLSRTGIRVSITEFPLFYHPVSLNVLEFSGRQQDFAENVLNQASEQNLLTAGRHWMVMTDKANVDKLLNILSTVRCLVDSDLVVGVITENSILIQEVYNTGRGGQQIVINLGSWSNNVNNNISHLNHHDWSLDLSGLKIYKFHRRENLQGLKFTVGVVTVHKMFCQTIQDEQNKTQLVGGYASTIFNEIEKSLNFTSEVHVLPGYAFGIYTKANDSWSGLTGELQRKEIDMTGCELSSTPERFLHLDFSQPILIIGRRLYYKRPSKVFHADAFLRPFSGEIWATLCVTLPAVAGLAYLLGWCSPFRAAGERVDSYGNHFFGLLSTLLLQGWPDVYSDTPRRALLWTAMVTYLVISVSYSAKMVALRTTEKPSLPISSLEDVHENSDWNFGFVAAALERNFFQAADITTIMGKLWQRITRKSEQSLVADVTSGLRRALDQKYVFLGFHWSCQEILEMKFTEEEACQLQVINNKDYFKGGMTFGLQKHSPFLELIDYRIQLMREAGVLDRMAKQSLPKPVQCEDAPFSMIALIDVAPALMLLGCGMLASLLILTIEVLWKRRVRRKLARKWRIVNIHTWRTRDERHQKLH